ncbi:tyrosine-protein kinase receptor Tie-1-like [Lingula anatina]|uniref:Tyrosine-protein kinase receptor Tie-1-like n=1 Tax=Lingula anatina TaxID=7574 RepID=A0A1S3J2W3_LINAN|nr:tyrosine-protein kinase receptor Tie-1-like [Lingula anatina]|eukprot:XP_013404750.1 tyrosine-protein kinase receptor Tie-1-like [Lingula anatina]
MLEKLEFMGNVPRHENVLIMLGKVTDDIHTGPYMVLEYCKNGTLRDWLLAQKARGGELSADTADRMTEYGAQIASGMEHLSNNMIIHKKLMSKNVLLNGRMVAKVAGFGPEGRDAAKDKSRLPTKWMALEVLQDPELNFTAASDVWAYGITLWEIYSLGDLPYTTGNKGKLIGMLESGVRPERPTECPEAIYNDMILKCLYNDPSARPTFPQIKDKLYSYFHPSPDDHGMYYRIDN